MIVRAVLRTDVGLVRTENQDFGVLTTAEEERASGTGQLLVVADGMGGHRGGATASRLSGETVKEQYLSAKGADPSAALRDALTRANAKIFSESLSNPDLRGMGTTTSALAIRDSQGWFAHVGDSRIYLIRHGEITQLTDDHSLVASMVREGLLTAKEAETHPRRNVLQRSMGVAEDVEIDVKGPISLEEGDIFVLCSDGLHGLVKEDELREVATQMPIERAADEYLRLALQRGAPDNVTLIVAQVVPNDSPAHVLDPAAFEETLRDVPLVKPESLGSAVTEQLPKVEVPKTTDAAAPAAPAEDAATGNAAPEKTAATETRARRNGKLFLWLLLLIVVAGAVGAWYFAGQLRPAGTSSTQTTR